jgi:site-specific recombinase XerC
LALFESADVTDPRLLDEAAVNRWVAGAKSNNTLRGRMTRACVFLRWCARRDLADPRLVEDLSGRDNPLRDIPPLYGKVQGKYPPRWLSYEEAFGVLLGTCDCSDLGRRDERVLRLDLAGMRVAETVHLVAGEVRMGAEPTMEWIGKKNRHRKVSIGPAMVALFSDYFAR